MMLIYRFLLVSADFKSVHFDFEDKERPALPTKFEDEELEAMLGEEQCQTLNRIYRSIKCNENGC